MPQRLFHLYQRKRIVNVNTNVVLAGIAAMALTLIPLNLSRHYLGGETFGEKVLITLIAGAFDIAFDVLIYYGLHWVANHWRPKWAKSERSNKGAFLQEATVVQIERVILSPVYYIVALGVKLLLLTMGMEREWAFVIGFVIGIAITRVLHTVWGLRTGRFEDNMRVGSSGEALDLPESECAQSLNGVCSDSAHVAQEYSAEEKPDLSRLP